MSIYRLQKLIVKLLSDKVIFVSFLFGLILGILGITVYVYTLL